MSQHNLRTKQRTPPRKKGRGLFLAIMALGSIVAIALLSFLVWSLATGGEAGGDAKVTPEVTGAPKLKADRDVLDLGEIKLGNTVEATFMLSNAGDRPLLIAEKPYIEVLEGC